MYISDDLAFKTGEVETYAYVFQNARKEFNTEYIHCIVLERLDKEVGEQPKRIKVNQIHNLEMYMSNPDSYDNFSERILNTDHLTELLGTKR